MSVVWHAFDEVLQRDVAVKLLKPEFAEDGQLRTAIRREARAAAKLSHPGIASVFDYGETGSGASFVVMELVTGSPFAVRLHDGAVPWREAVSVCGQVASAMAQAHAQGVVHRDIKPGNVMVTATGVKVVDFGISAVIGEADQGQLVGTPAYMAPERLTGRRADSPTDVYALGLMLYRSLAGELPWPAASASQVLSAHAAGPPRLRRPPDVPDEIMDACQACVVTDPARRPTMADLARTLTGATPDGLIVPVPARAVELALPLTKAHLPPRRRRHLVYTGIAAAVLLVAMVAALTSVSDGPPPDPGASFGDAAVPGPATSLPAASVVPVRADDNSGPGHGNDDGTSNSGGNGHGGSNGNSGRRG
jgi:serine/threonine protein kinase